MSWKRFFSPGRMGMTSGRGNSRHIFKLKPTKMFRAGCWRMKLDFAANRKLGNAMQIREEIFRMNSVGFLETLWQDVKYGVRAFAAKPGFTFFAITVLALGIAANTSIFSLTSAVLLRALPYPNSERLVMVWEDSSYYGFPENTPSPGNYNSWNTQNHTFDGMAAFKDISPNLTGDGEPERLSGKRVTANFFSVLGVAPFMGSDFRAGRRSAGNESRGDLSVTGMWLTRFGGDPQVIGKQIVLDNENYIVKGRGCRVDFQFEERGDGNWAPLGLSAAGIAKSTIDHYLEVVGRLPSKPVCVTLAQANSELGTIAAQMQKNFRTQIPMLEPMQGRCAST